MKIAVTFPLLSAIFYYLPNSHCDKLIRPFTFQNSTTLSYFFLPLTSSKIVHDLSYLVTQWYVLLIE